MSQFDKLKTIAKLFIPPIAYNILRLLIKQRDIPVLEYAPEGWKTILKKANGWNAQCVVAAEKSKWNTFFKNCQGTGPLGFSHEDTDLTRVQNVFFHNIHLTFAYALALAAHLKTSLSVLDWGGGLGHYYLIGKAVMPDLQLDYTIKEVPLMAETARQLLPEVHWFSDETCLERHYDFVMINGSLQYIEHWEDTLRRIAHTAKTYLLLTRIPVVDKGPSFVAIQRAYGSEMFHHFFDQMALLEIVKNTGMRLIREFVVGDRFDIKSAPGPGELRGWLFKKNL
jgi:putative methyltransferase (TIGR04325 family)